MIDPKLEAALQEIVDTLAAVTVKVESRVYGTGSYITRPLRERIAAASVLAQAALASVASTPPAHPVLAPVVREPLNKHVVFNALSRDAQRRTSVENVEDVLTAIAFRYGIHPTEGQRSHD